MQKKIKSLIQSIVNNLGYEIVVYDRVMDKEFGDIHKKCKNYTMTSKERMFSIYKSVEYIVKRKIPGDFVECGVWRGGSAMVIAQTLLKFGERNRKIYLYDTYEGMSKPTEEDKTLFGGTKAIDEWKKEQKNNFNNFCFASLEEVKKNLYATGYPKNNIIFIKGKVEETIPKTIPKKIALLRLDTDWYESTKHELTSLYPILSKNGILIIDDYGHWQGSKKAIDEYFKNKPILLNRIDYTGRVGIKTDK